MDSRRLMLQPVNQCQKIPSRLINWYNNIYFLHTNLQTKRSIKGTGQGSSYLFQNTRLGLYLFQIRTRIALDLIAVRLDFGRSRIIFIKEELMQPFHAFLQIHRYDTASF